MRISTSLLFETGAARIGELQSKVAKTQDQLSSGKRILTPSDDPVAAAQVLGLRQSQSINSQYKTNRENARSTLNLEEGTLQSVTELMQDMKATIVEAGNGSLDDTQRSYLATQLNERLEQLIGLANTRDGNGDYLFSGYRSTTQPFSKTSTGAQYSGDQGQRMAQAGPKRQIAMSDAGSRVFEAIKNGNGTFATAAAGTNTGSGVVYTGLVEDASALTGDDYQINFTSATDYEIVDATTSTTIASGTYTSGQSIAFDGIRLTIRGAPAGGDQFTVEPSANESVFTTLTNLVNALNTPATDDASRAKLSNALVTAGANMTNALDNILTVRASVGSRLSELDALDDEGNGRDIEYTRTITELESLDYTKAITALSEQSTMLQASQASFVKMTSLSLFSYLT